MKDFMNKSKERERLIGGKGVDPAIEEEQSLRKKVTKGAWGIATDKANIHLSMEKVQSYEEAFAKIQKATKITDIDELVHTFVHAEDQNFSLFNYVNDLANEIEKLEEQISNVKSEIEKYKGSGENTDAARKKLIAELELKLQKNHAKAKTAEEKFQQSSRTLNALKSGVGNIFQRLGCSSLAASELLGNAGVTESNMMQYLGLIEQRTNELVTMYQQQRQELAGDSRYALMPAVTQRINAADSVTPSTQSQPQSTRFATNSTQPSSSHHSHSHPHPHPPSTAHPHSSYHSHPDTISIHAPSMFDDDGDDDGDGEGDEDVRPLTREELHRQHFDRQHQQQYQQGDEY